MLVQIRIRIRDFLHRYMPSSWVQSASRSWSVREWVSASTRSAGDNVGRERSSNSLRVCPGLHADFN